MYPNNSVQANDPLPETATGLIVNWVQEGVSRCFYENRRLTVNAKPNFCGKFPFSFLEGG